MRLCLKRCASSLQYAAKFWRAIFKSSGQALELTFHRVYCMRWKVFKYNCHLLNNFSGRDKNMDIFNPVCANGIVIGYIWQKEETFQKATSLKCFEIALTMLACRWHECLLSFPRQIAHTVLVIPPPLAPECIPIQVFTRVTSGCV